MRALHGRRRPSLEERFRTPEILCQHGVHCAMNVILQGEGRPLGVLEVDSRSDDEFIERRRRSPSLRR
ncbi:MAG: hypothetical protein J0J01_00775 [Reyranella sp.]|uniref:hypothetical protein n=1 Tax=Reyranella sp. TaxID=1929291 RepID=UPI001ACAF551|nr:hypothetical protein [Reyranella sp.]MBN9085413.1 hypothetical protein [Reyranella sp.]